MRPNVLILEAQAKASLPIIESCHRHGLRVIVGGPSPYCAGFYSRAVRQRLIYPSPVQEPQGCLRRLLSFLARHPVAALFPVGDVMTDLIARHQDQVRRHTNVALCAYEVFVQGRSKIGTLQAAEAAGVPIPRTWYPQRQPIEQIAAEACYPSLIKPAISAGARGITLVRGADELLAKWPEVCGQYGESFVQEFVPQHGTQYKVDMILGAGGKMLAGVAYAKLRYYPPTGGSSVLNETVDRPEIVGSALKVLQQLGWYGFCDFDFIEDPRDGVIKLMEINPRYPESFRATVAAGLDMPYMMYRLAVEGACPPDLSVRTGKYVRFLAGDLLWFLTSADRWRARPGFFHFLDRDTLYQILSARDLGPAMGYLLENVIVLLNPAALANRLRLRQARGASPHDGTESRT